jgi:uncharacterized protein (DUF1330 family)
MPSFAIAQLRNVHLGPEIVAYLAAIDQTLAPYGGQFLVHGNPLTRLEGQWPDGDVILVDGVSDTHKAMDVLKRI